MAKAKEIAKLNCQHAAGEIIRQVLLTRMKKMCALRDRALDWNDPEGVHDMRVASRRLRSALSDFKPYLRKGSIPISRLKAIAKSLGAVRDEDVIIAALDKLRSKADEKVVPGIEAMAEEHRGQRRQACSILEREITAFAIGEFRDDFRGRLGTAPKIRDDRAAEEGGDQVLTFSEVGAKIIGGRLKELSDAGESVYLPLETKQLHKLRILAKRLRYAIELFTPCWGDEFKKSAAEIARFQTSLGELHDCDVWIVNLGDRLKQNSLGAATGLDPGRTNEAAVWLLHHFVAERTKHYCRSLARWHKWNTDGFLERLRNILEANFTLAQPKSQKRPPSRKRSAPLIRPHPKPSSSSRNKSA